LDRKKNPSVEKKKKILYKNLSLICPSKKEKLKKGGVGIM